MGLCTSKFEIDLNIGKITTTPGAINIQILVTL